MATSDFLTFSAAAGANVLTQSAYADAGNTDRATGYVTGTASSQAVNKTLRQASIISAMVAQLIVDQTGQDAVDDGTIATLETNFTNAILAIAGNRIIQISDVVNLTATLASKLGVSDNAASASKLQTARQIALAGLVSGSANFDGSGNISISTVIADAALSIAKTSGLQSALNAKASLASPAFSGSPTAPTQSTADNSSSLATTAFARALFNSLVSASPGVIRVLGFKIQYGKDTCPASGAYQALRSVTWHEAFQSSPYSMAIAVTNSQAPKGPVVAYVNSNETTTSGTFAFDIAEGSGQSGIISSPIPFNWFAIGY